MTKTAKELIEFLQGVPPDTKVCVAAGGIHSVVDFTETSFPVVDPGDGLLKDKARLNDEVWIVIHANWK